MAEKGIGQSAGPAAAMGPLLSAVVCSYTPARLGDICEAMAGLQGQSYPNMETIFVADGSAELERLVEERVRKQGLASVRVVLNDGRPGLAAARNFGVEHAVGEMIAFIDDDAVPFPDWAEEIVRTLSQDDSIVGVTGPAFPWWEAESMAWFPEEFYWIISCPTPGWLGYNRMREVRNAWGMNMAFRREAFRACRFPEAFGYNRGPTHAGPVDLLGEDTAFSVLLRRLTGKAIVFNPRVRVRHKVYRHRLTPGSVRRRAFWEGYTKARLRKLEQEEREAGALDLAPERALLRRVALGFLPRVMVGFAREPGRSWRQLCLAVDVLAHVGLGYLAASFPGPGKWLARGYRS